MSHVRAQDLRRTLRLTASAVRDWVAPDDLTSTVISLIEGLPPSIKNDYLKSVYLTKFVDPKVDDVGLLARRAEEKWLNQELTNSLTEERLWNTPPSETLFGEITYSRFLAKLRQVIVQTIRDVPPDYALIGAFSGGATTSRPRRQSHPGLKYLGKVDITSDARCYFEETLSSCELWSLAFSDGSIELSEVPGNKMFTVPKNNQIDRVAAKEPDINMFLQKGAGSCLRSFLRRRGIDLNDQSRNRSLAQQGSKYNNLATIDLSSASDSVTCALVELALPDLWFSYLNALRSKTTLLLDGTTLHENVMFSSMGNGFTFELESLLFYAIAKTTLYLTGVPGKLSVYGDDIIVPSNGANDVISALSFFGFTTNLDKTFTQGPFRESCGGHYYNGTDITPFFIRRPITTLEDTILLANQVRNWSILHGCSILDDELSELYQLLCSLVPRSLYGGSDLGSSSALVAPCPPSFRLVRTQRDVRLSDSQIRSLYVYRLHLLDTRFRVLDVLIRRPPESDLTEQIRHASQALSPVKIGSLAVRRTRGIDPLVNSRIPQFLFEVLEM